MTTHNPYQDGQEQTADLVRSLALSSAKLWEELFERLHRIEVTQNDLRDVLAKLDIGLPSSSEKSPVIGSAGGTQGQLPAASSFEEALASAGAGVEDYFGHPVNAAQTEAAAPEPAASEARETDLPLSFEWHANEAPPPAAWGPPSGGLEGQHIGSGFPDGFSPSDEVEVGYDEVKELTVPPPPPPSPTVIFEAPASVAFETPSTVMFEAAGNGFAPPPPPPSNGFASATPPPGFASATPPPPPPPGFASASSSTATPPPPPAGFAAASSSPSPPPPPPGFASASSSPATPPPPPVGFATASSPPPPPPGFAQAPASTGEAAVVGHSGPSSNGHHMTGETGEAEDAQAFAITPDFFARAGRRRL
jgi:hypothetical protein